MLEDLELRRQLECTEPASVAGLGVSGTTIGEFRRSVADIGVSGTTIAEFRGTRGYRPETLIIGR